MKCLDCDYDIMAKDVTMCPNCFSRNLASDEVVTELDRTKTLKDIENFERAGRYEDAALLCEKLEMWDKAGEIRRKAKTSYVISANVNIAKIGSISMECPHCGASQPITSKSNEVTCSYCKKNYVIPKKVLELL
jgi:Zn finger protein HypA/HybF involved in hydrogenase expression